MAVKTWRPRPTCRVEYTKVRNLTQGVQNLYPFWPEARHLEIAMEMARLRPTISKMGSSRPSPLRSPNTAALPGVSVHVVVRTIVEIHRVCVEEKCTRTRQKQNQTGILMRGGGTNAGASNVNEGVGGNGAYSGAGGGGTMAEGGSQT